MYFVGKLFERIIRENSIGNFHYIDLLRKMCDRAPESRVQAFSLVLQELRNNQFSEVSFSVADRQAYRHFADELCEHITSVENGAKYFDDIQRIERQLQNAYQRFMLEETVPNCLTVTACFVNGTYYYKKAGFSVDAVRQFLNLLRTCTPERGQILLANLHTRLDTITRYSDQEPDDIPF